jgi:hypothetical protein
MKDVDNTQRVQNILQHIAKWLPMAVQTSGTILESSLGDHIQIHGDSRVQQWQWVTLKSFLTSVCQKILVTSISKKGAKGTRSAWVEPNFMQIVTKQSAKNTQQSVHNKCIW